MLIGIPPILSARLSLQQKIILGIIFGMGGFVIVAATLRAIYCLVPSLVSYVYMNWYFREASVAIYVTTLPGIWVFLKDMFPVISRMSTRLSTRPTDATTADQQKQISSRRQAGKHERHPFDSQLDLDVDLDTYPISKCVATVTETDLGTHATTPSDHSPGDADSTTSTRCEAPIAGIRCDTTFAVERFPRARDGAFLKHTEPGFKGA